jgi:hypothetical protein
LELPHRGRVPAYQRGAQSTVPAHRHRGCGRGGAARIDIGSKLAVSRNISLFESFDGELSDRSLVSL